MEYFRLKIPVKGVMVADRRLESAVRIGVN